MTENQKTITIIFIVIGIIFGFRNASKKAKIEVKKKEEFLDKYFEEDEEE